MGDSVVCRLVDAIYIVYFGGTGALCVVRLTAYYSDAILAFLSALFANG